MSGPLFECYAALELEIKWLVGDVVEKGNVNDVQAVSICTRYSVCCAATKERE